MYPLNLSDKFPKSQRAHSEIFNDNIKTGTPNKLRTYRMYKSENQITFFIKDRDQLKSPKSDEPRLSNHNLPIEVGRLSKRTIEATIC